MLDPQERVEAQAQEVALPHVKDPEAAEQMFLARYRGEWSRFESMGLFRGILNEYARVYLRVCLSLEFPICPGPDSAACLAGVPEQMWRNDSDGERPWRDSRFLEPSGTRA